MKNLLQKENIFQHIEGPQYQPQVLHVSAKKILNRYIFYFQDKSLYINRKHIYISTYHLRITGNTGNNRNNEKFHKKTTNT